MLELELPADPSAQLLWAQVVLAWMTATYGIWSGPYGREEFLRLERDSLRLWRKRTRLKAATVFAISVFLPGFGDWMILQRLALGTGTALLTLLVPKLRHWALESQSGGRLVLAVDPLMTICSVFLFAELVSRMALRVDQPFLRLPFTDAELTHAAVVASAAIFLLGAATHVIRLTLDQIEVKPKARPAADNGQQETDEPEYNRGRVIGNLERLLLLTLALAGAFEAIVLVIAAKGIVRWNDMQERDFAEYFLIGSLLSILLAVFVGLIVRSLL